MKKRMLFLVNPNAGRSQMGHHMLETVQRFTAAGYEVTAVTSSGIGDIINIVSSSAAWFDAVICCGGDGTLNETVNGLMRSGARPVLGYLPTGTVNDFATTYGLSRDVKTAVSAVVNGSTKQIDICRFAERYYTYVAAFGAFTDVSYMTPQNTKAMIGRMAYIFEGVKRIPKLKPVHMRINADGHVIEDDFIYGMVTNSFSVGGFQFFDTKKVKTDDGLVEVTLVKNPHNFQETQDAAISLLKMAKKSQMIYRVQAKRIEITSSENVQWTLDGEYGGSFTNVDISVVPQAITLMV